MKILSRSLTIKLTAAFLGVSVLSIALVALIGWISAANEFNRFVSQQAQNDFVIWVRDYYAANGNLAGIDDALRTSAENRAAPTQESMRFFPFGLADARGVVILPGDEYEVGVPAPTTQFEAGTRVLQDGQVIAVVLPFTRTPTPHNRAQEQYLERTGTTLALAAGGAALVAIVLGVLLARTITSPVRGLTGAVHQLAKGKLGQTVRVRSRDEVGELALAFNQMSLDLARADTARRQMTADIAHELRNPLTVIGGYLDAMRTGDLQPTPPRLETVYDEIQHLEHIVDDLRTLSMTDAGALTLHRETIPASELLQRVAARHSPQAAQMQLALELETNPQLPFVQVDEARMMQVLDNLVSNALQHTAPGGKVLLRGTVANGGSAIRLEIRDTGEGIAPDDLPKVFERFYRADKSRESSLGSSGLGLAIAKALVEAHGGRIWAESELGAGASFFVELPAVAPPAAPIDRGLPLDDAQLMPVRVGMN